MELTRQRAVGASRRPSPQKQKEEIEHADLQASCLHRSRLRRSRFDRRLRRQGRRLGGDGGRVAPSKTQPDASLGAGLRASHGRRFCVRGPCPPTKQRPANSRPPKPCPASAAAAPVGRPSGPHRDRNWLGHRLGEVVEEFPQALGQLFESVADRRRLPGVFRLAVGQAVLPGRSHQYRPGPRSGRHRTTKKPFRYDAP